MSQRRRCDARVVIRGRERFEDATAAGFENGRGSHELRNAGRESRIQKRQGLYLKPPQRNTTLPTP